VKVDYDDSVPGPDPQGALSAAKRGVIFQQILARVGSLPGVQAAGLVDYLPLGQNRAWGMPIPKGRNRDEFKEMAGPLVYVISPGYVRAMGTRLRGRDFTWDDGPKSEQVVLINEAMAHYFWPHEDAVGQILTNGGPDIRVAGVVDDVHEESVDGAAGWQIYYPMTQAGPAGAELVVRTTLEPASLAASVMGALRELNPKQTAAEFRPIKALVSHAVSPRRFFMLLVASFALLGLLLASLGIYGVISYSVTQRTQEIGIRMALGSTQARVQFNVLGNALRLVAMGIATGTAASIAVAKGIAALLFGTTPTDPVTFAGMALLLGSVALAAGYLPARRASRINPMVALRNQ
jgi:predicted permease